MDFRIDAHVAMVSISAIRCIPRFELSLQRTFVLDTSVIQRGKTRKYVFAIFSNYNVMIDIISQYFIS